MNAKKCKQLRRLAQEKTIGRENRRLEWEHRPTRDGGMSSMQVNSPLTTRGVYRGLKQMLKKLVKS